MEGRGEVWMRATRELKECTLEMANSAMMRKDSDKGGRLKELLPLESKL